MDHDTNKNVQDFLNLIHQNSLIPTINKPTRVTMETATVIDQILTNSFVDTNFKSAIFKTDIFDHFPICLFLASPKVKSESETTFIYERIVNTLAIEIFKQHSYQTNWKELKRIIILMKLTIFLYKKFFYYTTITFQKKR